MGVSLPMAVTPPTGATPLTEGTPPMEVIRLTGAVLTMAAAPGITLAQAPQVPAHPLHLWKSSAPQADPGIDHVPLQHIKKSSLKTR